jgi:hypothetical protein
MGEFPPSPKRALWKKMNLRDAETRRRLPCGYKFTTREQAMSKLDFIVRREKALVHSG